MIIFSQKRFILFLTCFTAVLSFYLNRVIANAEDKQPTVMEHWSLQIAADRLEETIPIGREIKDFYDKKFPSLAGRIYIEKSNDVVTVHWFADYPDVRSFRRINRQLGEIKWADFPE